MAILPDVKEYELEYEEQTDSGQVELLECSEPGVKRQTEELKIIRYEWRLVKRFSQKLYATCYSKEDGPTEAKGIYSNNKYAQLLHKSERRIQRHHWTVALPPELKKYHNELVYVNGKWTHKWRMHVPEYNTADKSRGFDAGYWAVPRDRMLQRGRIDVLFTTAGNYASIKQRQNAWARMNTHNTPVEFWELVKCPVYEKGNE